MIGDIPLCGNICLEYNVFQNLLVSLYGILLHARASLRSLKVSKNIRFLTFQPFLELIQGELFCVTIMLFRLGLFSPGGKLFLGNLPRLDPGEVPLVFPSVLAEYQILLAVLCPLLHRSDIPAELPGWLRPAAILCRDPSNNRKVSAAVSAPANWDIFCNTVPQRKINQSTDSVRIQNHSTGILTHRSETNRNRFEAKQFRIARLVKNIVRPEVLLYVSAHLVNIQNILYESLRLFLVQCELFRKLAHFFCHPWFHFSFGLAPKPLKIQQLEINVLLTQFTKQLHILLDFLVEFAGALELAEHRMTETLVEQSAISYKAHAEVVKMVKCRLTELYNDAAINCSKDEC